MHAVAHESFPGTVADGFVVFRLEVSFLDAPAHAVEEECSTRHLLATIVGIAHETRVPETVLRALAVLQGLTHQQEVLLQLLIVFVFRGEKVHAAHEGSIHPTIAATPVAVLAVGCRVGSYIVLVAPPESFLHVEESTSEGITAPGVHPHGVIGIFTVARSLVDLHIEWHCHLDSVDPGPPAVEGTLGLRLLRVGSLHLVVEVLDDACDLLVAATLEVTVGVGLAAALVVGIVGLHAVAWLPFMECCPTVGIVDVAVVLIDFVECHQSFVIDGSCPKRGRTDSVHVGRECRICILRHEVVVGEAQRVHYFICLFTLGKGRTCHQQGKESQ